MNSRSRSNRTRRGAALIEFAISMPVFFAIAMGTIEVCRLMYLRQSLRIAAYECARIGVIPGMPSEAIELQAGAILHPRGVTGYAVDHVPEDLDELHYGEILTVTITAPAAQNSLVGRWYYRNDDVVERVSIMAEY